MRPDPEFFHALVPAEGLRVEILRQGRMNGRGVISRSLDEGEDQEVDVTLDIGGVRSFFLASLPCGICWVESTPGHGRESCAYTINVIS